MQIKRRKLFLGTVACTGSNLLPQAHIDDTPTFLKCEKKNGIAG